MEPSEFGRLQEGDPAPDFTLVNQHGESVTLSEHRGEWVVFWWYPFAGTPG